MGYKFKRTLRAKNYVAESCQKNKYLLSVTEIKQLKT